MENGAQLEQSIQRLQRVKYANVASMAVLVFDFCLTFQSEMELIWPIPLGFVKSIYLLARYPVFFDVSLGLYYYLAPDIAIDHCRPIYYVICWSTTLGIGFAEMILIIRTYAFWGRSKKLLWPLVILFTAVYISVLVILTNFLSSIEYGPPLSFAVPGCHLVNSSEIIFGDFVLLMLLETVVMILTIYRAVKDFRHSSSKLVTVLYRDGIFFFLYMFIISAGNVVVIITAPSEYVDLLSTFQRVMHSVLSSRILLHLRAAGRRIPDDPGHPLSGTETWTRDIARPITTTISDTESYVFDGRSWQTN